MQIFLEWKDYFGEERAEPLTLDVSEPTFLDLFQEVEKKSGLKWPEYDVIYCTRNVADMNSFAPENPLSWFGIAAYATIQLEPKTIAQGNVQEGFDPNEVDMHFESPRFDVSDPAAYEYLEENGYVVIKEVLNSEEVAEAENQFWDWTCKMSRDKIKRDDVDTWGSHCGWIADTGVGIIHKASSGQSEWLWNVRSKPKVKQAFAGIWGTDELLVSFDTGGVFRPYAGRPDWKTTSGWFHVDQNGATLPDRACVQGLVSLKDGTPETGGLCVLPESHLQFQDFCQRNQQPPECHFLPINSKDPVRSIRPRLVQCKSGDLLLWDSRTVHCNTPGSGSTVTDDLIRIVAYVCMQPLHLVPEEYRALRETAWERHITSSHWISMYNELSPPNEYVEHTKYLTPFQKDLVWPGFGSLSSPVPPKMLSMDSPPPDMLHGESINSVDPPPPEMLPLNSPPPDMLHGESINSVDPPPPEILPSNSPPPTVISMDPPPDMLSELHIDSDVGSKTPPIDPLLLSMLAPQLQHVNSVEPPPSDMLPVDPPPNELSRATRLPLTAAALDRKQRESHTEAFPGIIRACHVVIPLLWIYHSTQTC